MSDTSLNALSYSIVKESMKNKGKQPPRRNFWRRFADTWNEIFNPRVKHSSYWFFLSGLMIASYIGSLLDHWEKTTILGCVLAAIVALAFAGLFLSCGIHEWKKEKIRNKLRKKQ